MPPILTMGQSLMLIPSLLSLLRLAHVEITPIPSVCKHILYHHHLLGPPVSDHVQLYRFNPTSALRREGTS